VLWIKADVVKTTPKSFTLKTDSTQLTTITVNFTDTAPTAVIATEISTITVGAFNPTITITVTGTNFRQDGALVLDDFTVNVGETGLSYNALSGNATYRDIMLYGTAAAGVITIQAKTSAFDPASASASNILTVTVSDPVAAIAAINAGTATLGTYTVAGITGVTSDNLTDVNAAVATARATKGSDLTKEQIQAVVDKGAAIKAINSGTATLPKYSVAEITGVTSGNLDDVNAAILVARGTKGSDLTRSEIQAVVNEVVIAAGATPELAKITDLSVTNLPVETAGTKVGVEAAMLVLANAAVAEGYTVTIAEGSTYGVDTNAWVGKFVVTDEVTAANTKTDGANRTITVVIAAPVIATAISTIPVGAINPTITITVTGTNFRSGMALEDLIVDEGLTGLTYDDIQGSGDGRIIMFSGIAAAGDITIQAATSAFSPASASASNILTITVPPVTASSNGIATATGRTTITLSQAITSLVAGDIVVKKDGVALASGTYTQSYVLSTPTIVIEFLAGAALVSTSVVTVVITKAGYVINGGDAIAVANTIPAVVKTVAVGEQAVTTPIEGPSYWTFAVTTTNITNDEPVTIAWFQSNGTTVASAPTGVTAAGSNVSNNASTITVNATSATPGSYYFKATIDGVTSAVVTVAIAPSSDARLSLSSTVKGVTLSTLGTPAATQAGAILGGVTITSTKALDTTTFITQFVPTDAGASITRVVKYAVGGDVANFANDPIYANEVITENDFFAIQITAANGSVLHYCIKVSIIG